MGPGTDIERQAAEGGEIVLRRNRSGDAERLAAAVGESLEHLRPWIPWASADAATVSGQRRAIGEVEALGDSGPNAVYVILAKPDDVLVGSCGLYRRVGARGIEIGYWIRAGHTRRGYATAATRALLRIAWALPDIDRVEIHCDEANVASQAIPRRLGFRLDRVEHQPVTAPGESGQHMIWILESKLAS